MGKIQMLWWYVGMYKHELIAFFKEMFVFLNIAAI
jgi:hypothetical protein